MRVIEMALRLVCGAALVASTMGAALAASEPSVDATLGLVPWPAQVAREGAGLRLAATLAPL